MRGAWRTATPFAAPLDSWIGRERPMATLRAASERDTRLCAIYGPIGQGKSRLLVEFGKREARAGSTVLHVDRAKLEARDASWMDVLEGLLDGAPRESARWLLIDHWEFDERSAAQCAALLSRWPAARVWIASRARWPASVASAFELEPLSVVSERDGAPSESTALMLDRLDRTADLTDEQRAQWASIAEELEGNPQAIEVIAASSTSLDVAQAQRRIDALLRASEPLRAAHEEVWRSLAEPARRALVACSVFRGSFTLEAAEVVLGGDRALDALQRLRDASLLRSTRIDGERAFSLSRVTAAWLQTKRDPAQIDAARERAARYFIAEGERCASRAETHRSSESLAWIQRERENILASAERAVESGDGALAARAALLLQRARTGRDAASFRALLDRVLRLCDERSTDLALLAELLRARGNTLRSLGQFSASIEDLARASTLADTLGDRRARGRARIDMAATHSATHQRAEAERAFRAGLEDARATHDHGYVITASTFLGYLELDRGDAERARAMLEEALAGARALVDPRRETTCLYCLGLIAHDQASLDLAEDFYERARALAVEQRDKGHEGVAALMLAVLALERDEPDRACALARVARDTLGDVDPATATIAQTYLAVALAAQGSASAAREALESARELARDRDDSAARAVCERLEAVVEWSEAREASRRAKHSRAERLLASAGARLRQQEAPSTVDLRIAHRVVERWLERESIAAPAREALVVATDGSWFSLRGGARISLTRHRSAQRLLAALAQQRVEKPGVGLSHAALVARGWPGQRILPSAAALRLRATIKQLRSLGLAEVLETLPGAYALRASVSIRLSEPTAHC